MFLKDEMSEARKAVQALDSAVAAASSHREKASMMLEEAHRALSRLEQVRGGGRGVVLRGQGCKSHLT